MHSRATAAVPCWRKAQAGAALGTADRLRQPMCAGATGTCHSFRTGMRRVVVAASTSARVTGRTHRRASSAEDGDDDDSCGDARTSKVVAPDGERPSPVALTGRRRDESGRVGRAQEGL
eukprot:scaffold2404_cov398-Prasinococcus_capsulatus_cf.AAC.22